MARKAAETDAAKGTDVEKGDDAPKPKAAPATPVRVNFGMKPKVLPSTNPGMGQSIFKSARAEKGDEAPAKKIKL